MHVGERGDPGVLGVVTVDFGTTLAVLDDVFDGLDHYAFEFWDCSAGVG